MKVFMISLLTLGCYLPLTANAGCATNQMDGRIYCGPGDCAVDSNGQVFCSAYAGGGAALNRNDGRVYCGTGPQDTSATVNLTNCILAR